jgi:hypothetical protein
MELIEIIVIIACIIIVGGVIGRYIYRVVNKLPTGDCACCSKTKRGNKLVKAYKKKYKNCSK